MALLWAALLFAGSQTAAQAQPGCAMEPGDRSWVQGSLRGWEVIRRDRLRLPPSRPAIIVFDARCRYEMASGSGGWTAEPHDGTIRMPHGVEPIQVGVTSFTSGGEGRPPFFVMALPSVWRAAGISGLLGLDAGLQGVFLHEYMHATQAPYLRRAFQRMQAAGAPEDISDDALQARFADDPEYGAAFERERSLLYAAATEPSLDRARQLAGEALAAMRARQSRWLTGDNAYWKHADDLFLTMEGVGQWSAYAWLSHPRGWALSPALAARAMRGGRRWWSQEEGLALFLVIDRLLPGWQAQAFSANPALGIDLLAEAVGDPAT